MIKRREVDAEIWGHALTTLPFVPLQQSSAYGAALARRGRVIRRLLIEDDGHIALGIQAATRKLTGWPLVTTALRGPFAFVPQGDLSDDAFIATLGAAGDEATAP